MPWYALLGFAVTAGLMAAFNFQRLRSMLQRRKDHPETMNDEWDPFG